jgi:hypothetical protein
VRSEVALDHVGVLDPASAITIDEAGSVQYLVSAILVLIEDARRHDELLEILQASVRCPNEAVDVVVHSGVVAVAEAGASPAVIPTAPAIIAAPPMNDPIFLRAVILSCCGFARVARLVDRPTVRGDVFAAPTDS